MTGAPTITDPREPPNSVELLTAGSSFARYEIVRCIGVGGMGAVFEAMHTLLRKRVALKALHAGLGRSEASRARFLREAETVARIRHANVVDISDVGIERGIPFLVMEFLEGEDLAALLEREGKLSVRRTVDLLLPAIAGLCAVHRLGIVHRDIKPENIFLSADGFGGVVPKLVDFGVSKDLEASSAEGPAVHHTVAGTPYYMSPEQSRGSAVLDGRADQYAMGVVAYQSLSLQRPFESGSLLELIHLIDAGDYTPLRERCPDLSEDLAAVVSRAMARRVEERFPTTEAFGQALSPFASEAVAAACARDFALEQRRSALPGARASWSQEALERLSAPTRVEGLSPLSDVPDVPAQRRSLSGVRARDTNEALPAPSKNARSRRAFFGAASFTFLLLVAAASVYWWQARVPGVVKTEPIKAEHRASPAGSSSPAIGPARASEPSLPPPLADEGGAKPHSVTPRTTRPRRDNKPDVVAPPVDIQLSR